MGVARKAHYFCFF